MQYNYRLKPVKYKHNINDAIESSRQQHRTLNFFDGLLHQYYLLMLFNLLVYTKFME